MPRTACPKPRSLLEFPCAFPIKIMGRTRDGFAQAMLEVVLRHAPDFDRASMEMRASREGNYLSLTCTVNATSREQLDNLYRELVRDIRGRHGAVAAVAAARLRWRVRRALRGSARLGPHRLRRRPGARCRRSPTRARRNARRNLADRASADLHAGPGRPARAPAARQRHPGAQGRSRRPGHLSRSRAARRLPAVRHRAADVCGVRATGPGDRGQRDRIA